MRTPKVCVSITADTTAELRERRDRVTHADLVELRVDSVRDPSAAGALAGRRMPVVFTCRPAWEGGHFMGSEDERKRLLSDAMKLGAEYVDVEWRANFTDLIAERGGRGIVLSMHDFNGVPADLAERAAAMRTTGAEVVKIAVTARRLSDCLQLMPIGRDTAAPTAKIAMGDAGVPTRILAGRFGSCWVYAGDAVAPGQIPATELCEQFSFRSIAERTALYGIVGRPIRHSVSPAMHNAAFRAARLDAVYLPLAAADFDDFLGFASTMGVDGVSVTAPFKVDAYEHADESDAVSRRVQSVNTLRRDGTRWVACNTDVSGFLEPLKGIMPLQDLRATVLGAGGAARAVGEALVTARATVTFVARRREQAEEIARMTGASTAPWPPAAGSWDLLVNATPVGTAPTIDESPLPDGPFTGRLVYDLVYNPPETRLLRDAQAAGCRTLGGLDMLIAQAQQQFEWWTGMRPSDRVMREAAASAIGVGVRGAELLDRRSLGEGG